MQDPSGAGCEILIFLFVVSVLLMVMTWMGVLRNIWR